jgi:hypothetical protein
MPSDLIVSQPSQRAEGLGASGGDPPADFPADFRIPTVHSVDPAIFRKGPDALSRDIVGIVKVFSPTHIADRVIELLNQPVTSEAYGPILP